MCARVHTKKHSCQQLNDMSIRKICSKLQQFHTNSVDWDIIRLIFSYCDPETLGRCSFSCSQFNQIVTDIADASLKVVQARYYSSTSKLRPIVGSKLCQLNELFSPTIIIIRGFLTYQLSLSTLTMKRCGDTRRDRGSFCAVACNGEIYALGTSSMIAAGTVEKFNPFTNMWYAQPNLPRKLQYASAAVLDKRLYVVGGFDVETNMLSSMIYSCDPSLTTKLHPPTEGCFWSPLATMVRPRAKHLGAAFEGEIWIAGGQLEDGSPTNRFVTMLVNSHA